MKYVIIIRGEEFFKKEGDFMSQDIHRLQHDGVLPDFDELDESSFIWIPLKDVPIDEHYPVNSMRQPALEVFELLTWAAISPFATEEQQILRELALEHAEMGYFLLHHQDVFGIIGVDEYNDGWTPGRAVVFNAARKEFWHRDDDPVVMLKLVYSELKYPCKSFIYTPGGISNHSDIYNESYRGPVPLDG